MELTALENAHWDNPGRTSATGLATFDGADQAIPYTFITAEWPDVVVAIAAGEFGAVAPYTPPAAAVPFQITMRQAKLCLHRAGMLQAADAAIASMDGDGGIEAQIEWSVGTTLERTSATVQRVADELELPDEQIDVLFIWAAAL